MTRPRRSRRRKRPDRRQAERAAQADVLREAIARRLARIRQGLKAQEAPQPPAPPPPWD